ncbi:MAG: hypothetical protein ACRDYA_06350 [Egibacteraceae bacterium]
MRKKRFVPVPRAAVDYFRPGEEADQFERGDFILTHSSTWAGTFIRFGQRLRIHGEDRKYAYWNHAAIVVSGSGDLIESLGVGVSRTHISKYKPAEYQLVCTGASPEDRKQAVAFAEWAAGDGQGNGRQRYDFLTIASLAYSLLSGGKFTLCMEGHMICSCLVARAMERTGVIYNRGATHIMPADLAKYYQVQPPAQEEPASRPTSVGRMRSRT